MLDRRAFRIFAPDMVGLGYTSRRPRRHPVRNANLSVDQVVGLMDSLELPKASLPSAAELRAGRCVAAASRARHPDRSSTNSVLMEQRRRAASTSPTDSTPCRGTPPTFENMRVGDRLLRLLPWIGDRRTGRGPTPGQHPARVAKNPSAPCSPRRANAGSMLSRRRPGTPRFATPTTPGRSLSRGGDRRSLSENLGLGKMIPGADLVVFVEVWAWTDGTAPAGFNGLVRGFFVGDQQ